MTGVLVKQNKFMKWLRSDCWKFTSILLLCAMVSAAGAQTRHKKRSSTRIPAATSVPVATDPEVISRADDFPNNSLVLTPSQSSAAPLTGAETSDNSHSIDDLEKRIKMLEAGKATNKEEKQKRLLLNLDILTRAEDRASTLRRQLFEMIDKENTIKARLDAIENDIRPEAIERQVAMAGSLRPEELRAARRKSLEIEKSNLQSLLLQIQQTKTNLDQNVQRADAMVEKLRARLEKEIDTALDDTDRP
jgi:hypothetical protein